MLIIMLNGFGKTRTNLAKLDNGLDGSPTVMVGEEEKKRRRNKREKIGKNRGIIKPSWAFVETKSFNFPNTLITMYS